MATINTINDAITKSGEAIINAGREFDNRLNTAVNSLGDYTTFGSNDRRHGAMGLIIGPMYTDIWQDLTVVVSTLLGMQIGDYCDFNTRMYGYMTRLMLINLWEKNTTLSMLSEGSSNQANGDSSVITHEVQKPPYTQGNNYLETARELIANEKGGVHATRARKWGNTGNPYAEYVNLYPDELDTYYAAGKDDGDRSDDMNRWDVSDPNSILYKTKQLFRQHKINSLISRFGTNADSVEGDKLEYNGQDMTKAYGESRGHNLLTKDAEEEGGRYLTNGYNNPYCRVWTHHHQMDRMNRAMRAFQEDGKFKNIGDTHRWNGELWMVEENGDPTHDFGWREGGDYARWDKSVLAKRGDGLISITPKFLGGGEKNIHTKDCMFSIENLAWKDYDPYSFEKALSWEQRGPLGGRIMWFPPYGISFTETTQAQWSSNTFIGRGEDVYTYVNTKRTGTLRFMMLVDHPSITDYVSWFEANKDYVKDTDILRYFAGCDPADGNNPDSLHYYAHPTPLTDEGVRKNSVVDKREALKPQPKEKVPETVEKVEFNVFFPNNYSGVFDREENNVLFPWMYLLAGENAQQDLDGNIIEIDTDNPRGYETKAHGVTDDTKVDSVIIGNERFWKNIPEGSTQYERDESKKYFYRIDGKYEVPTKKEGMVGNTYYTNTYDQKLTNPKNYKDTKTYWLNCDTKNQKQVVYGGADIPKYVYAFSEVVEALGTVGKSEYLKSFFEKNKINTNTENVKKLVETFSESLGKKKTRKLTKIEIKGYSNSQGDVDKNKALAYNRGVTIRDAILFLVKDWKGVGCEPEAKPSVPVKGNDITTLEAKSYRSANCVLTFESEKDEAVAETEQENQEYIGFKKTQDKWGEYDLYVDDSGEKWVKREKADGTTEMLKISTMVDDSLANETFWKNVVDGKFREYTNEDGVQEKINVEETEGYKTSLFNKVRYEQEYYFYKKIKEEKPIIYDRLLEKLQYFDPAFHSMTPEGFNARLTFLNQCTRQGPTVGVSDKNRLSASNMAFGRPPFCVLRIGDFYNQMIVIDSINIDYDVSQGITWDLNDEGVGVQPMLAQISMNFTFIGGGSLDGPVRRLQNAWTSNFYSNSELYDNRADRITYNYDRGLTMGGAGKGNVDTANSYYYSGEMYDEHKLDEN